MMLSNRQLSRVCHTHPHTRHTFMGCYTYDTLPARVAKYPSFYIVDTTHSLSNTIGHWVLAIFPGERCQGEFFDSLGRDPSYYHSKLLHFLLANATQGYEFNPLQVQATESDSCGSFVCFVADKRSIGLSLQQAVELLSTEDLHSNDQVVDDYFIKHMSGGSV